MHIVEKIIDAKCDLKNLNIDFWSVGKQFIFYFYLILWRFSWKIETYAVPEMAINEISIQISRSIYSEMFRISIQNFGFLEETN